MKVLIVDDDIPTTQVIRDSLDWARLGAEKVLVAHNALSAMRLLDREQPELVLCDIEMPKGSGLDVIRYAREKHYESQFVFLTCHADFQYASEALRYEAVDYLTKPFDVAGLQAAVLRCIRKSDGLKEQKENAVCRESWDSEQPRRAREFWQDLLLGRIAPEKAAVERELQQLGLSLPPEESRTLVLCALSEHAAEQLGWERMLPGYALQNMAEELYGLPLNTPYCMHYEQAGREFVAMALPPDVARGAAGAAQKLIDSGLAVLKCRVGCYIRDGVPLEALSAARQEMESIDRKNIGKRGRVLRNEELTAAHEASGYSVDLQELERLLSEKRGSQAVSLLHSETETLMETQQMSFDTLHRIHEDYMQLVYAMLYRSNIRAHELFSDEASQKLFDASENSVFDLIRWASAITMKMLSYQEEVRRAKGLIGKIETYIEEHCGEELSRDKIAASVYLSPDYASKLFKAETGIALKDYITDTRIRLAKQLLADDSLSVSRVAQQVGLDNFSYFSTVFKKATGMTPREYKQKYSPEPAGATDEGAGF